MLIPPFSFFLVLNWSQEFNIGIRLQNENAVLFSDTNGFLLKFQVDGFKKWGDMLEIYFIFEYT